MTATTNAKGTLAWAGEIYPIDIMSLDALYELRKLIADCAIDAHNNYELETITRRELEKVQGLVTKATDKLDKQIDVLEALESHKSRLAPRESAIASIMAANPDFFFNQLNEYLIFNNMPASEFGERIGKAWELALDGRFNLPKSDGPYLIDSQKMPPGNAAYQVYADIMGKDTSCVCEDYSFHAGRKGLVCKHVLAVVLIEFARRLVGPNVEVAA